MATLAKTRKQRLRTLEKEIRSGMEEFYHTGMKLKEIRDDELYKEDGFETWERYCRERWEWSRDYALKLITAAEYRQKLPSNTTGSGDWSERSIRELTRIPDKRQAARVATKVVREVEKSRRLAAKDPDAKPLELSSSTVRRFVDEDLGIKPEEKKKPKRKDNQADLRDYIDRAIGLIEGTHEALQAVPDNWWKLLSEDHPRLIGRLIAACSSLAAFLEDLDE